jgi:hypothetical protein
MKRAASIHSLTGSSAALTLENSLPAASQAEALNSGYHLAFIVGAVFAGLASVLAVTLLRERAPQSHLETEAAAAFE